MKLQELAFIDLNSSIINAILGNERLKCLQRHAEVVGYIESFARNHIIYPKEEEKERTNKIYLKDKVIYLSPEGWNLLYINIQKITESFYNSQKTEEFEDKAILIQKANLDFSIDQICKNILERKRKDELVDTLRVLWHNNSKDSREALRINLQYIIVQQYRRKKAHNNKLFSIPYTSFCSLLGYAILEYALLRNVIFRKIINFYKTRQNTANLSFSELSDLRHYVGALLSEDTEQIDVFYTKYFGPIIDVKNKLLSSLISDYMLFKLFSENSRNNLPFISTKLILESYKDFDYFKASSRLNINLIKLASIFVTEGEKIYTPGIPSLFTVKNVIESVNKMRAVVYIESSIVSKLLEGHSVNKPYLTSENSAYLEKGSEHNTILNTIYQNKAQFVHPNINTELQFHHQCYLNTERIKTKYTIDRISLLTFLNEYWALFSEEGNYDKKDLFCSTLYDIKILGATITEDAELNVYQKLTDFGLEFNDDSKLEEEIKHLLQDKNINPLFLDIFNKMRNYKIFILGLLKDLLLYLPYEYFILDGFLDARGRYYYNTDFMNIQTFPFCKAFIKIYREGAVNANNFEKIKEVTSQSIKDDRLKKKLLAIPYEEYIQEEEVLLKQFICGHFIKESFLSENEKLDHRQLLENLESSNFPSLLAMDKSLFNKFIKKKNRTFYVLSLLYYTKLIKEAPHIYSNLLPYYELDATASGLQMCSIFLRSKEMAYVCNLIGEENIDIYSKVVSTYDNTVKNLGNFVGDLSMHFGMLELFESIPNRDYSEIIIHREDFDSTKNNRIILLGNFIFMNIEESTYAYESILCMYEELRKTFDFERYLAWQGTPQWLKSIEWLLGSRESKLCDNFKLQSIHPDHLRLLVLYRTAFRLRRSLIRLNLLSDPKFFSWRDLFKDAVMTFFYNSTSYGRKEKFIDLLHEFTSNKKNINHKEKLNHFYTIAGNLDKFFLNYITFSIMDSGILFSISKLFSAYRKPVIINNTIFIITYYPREHATITIETPTYQKKRGTQLVIKLAKNEFNQTEFNKGFIPNLIHSLDAFVAHTFISKNMEINKRLYAEMVDYQIGFNINHDTFGLTAKPFLRILLEDCYLTLFKANPINWIMDNLSESGKEELFKIMQKQRLDLEALNPYFAK